MEKSPKHYWAVYEGENVLFSGSFNDCWKHFVTSLGSHTVSALAERGVRIGRHN